jgi:hypothetical protein
MFNISYLVTKTKQRRKFSLCGPASVVVWGLLFGKQWNGVFYVVEIPVNPFTERYTLHKTMPHVRNSENFILNTILYYKAIMILILIF